MQVSGVVALQYKDGPQIFIPSTLLQTDSDGQRWLKLRASSVTIAKLVLGHMEKFKKATDGLSSCFFTMVTMVRPSHGGSPVTALIEVHGYP